MSSLGAIRKALDEFCAERSVAIDSPLAINAAHYLVAMTGQELDLRQLRDQLDSWSRTHGGDRPSRVKSGDAVAQ